MNFELGKHFRFIFADGSKIAGELTDIRMIGKEVYSIWIDIGRQPVYIANGDEKEIIEIDNYENEH